MIESTFPVPSHEQFDLSAWAHRLKTSVPAEQLMRSAGRTADRAIEMGLLGRIRAGMAARRAGTGFSHGYGMHGSSQQLARTGSRSEKLLAANEEIQSQLSWLRQNAGAYGGVKGARYTARAEPLLARQKALGSQLDEMKAMAQGAEGDIWARAQRDPSHPLFVGQKGLTDLTKQLEDIKKGIGPDAPLSSRAQRFYNTKMKQTMRNNPLGVGAVGLGGGLLGAGALAGDDRRGRRDGPTIIY